MHIQVINQLSKSDIKLNNLKLLECFSAQTPTKLIIYQSAKKLCIHANDLKVFQC